MKCFIGRIFILFLAVISKISFAAESCTGLDSKAQKVQENFSVRCQSAIAQKTSADGQAANAGKIEAGEAANIEVGAAVLGKVANFNGRTAFTAWELCRTAVTDANKDMQKIKKEIIALATKAKAEKNVAEVKKCTTGMEKVADSMDKLGDEYLLHQDSLGRV